MTEKNNTPGKEVNIDIYSGMDTLHLAKLRVGEGLDTVLGFIELLQNIKEEAKANSIADYMRSKESRYNFIIPIEGEDNYVTIIRKKVDPDDLPDFSFVASNNVTALELYLDSKYETGFQASLASAILGGLDNFGQPD